jgi:hypothetical protein
MCGFRGVEMATTYHSRGSVALVMQKNKVRRTPKCHLGRRAEGGVALFLCVCGGVVAGAVLLREGAGGILLAPQGAGAAARAVRPQVR